MWGFLQQLVTRWTARSRRERSRRTLRPVSGTRRRALLLEGCEDRRLLAGPDDQLLELLGLTPDSQTQTAQTPLPAQQSHVAEPPSVAQNLAAQNRVEQNPQSFQSHVTLRTPRGLSPTPILAPQVHGTQSFQFLDGERAGDFGNESFRVAPSGNAYTNDVLRGISNNLTVDLDMLLDSSRDDNIADWQFQRAAVQEVQLNFFNNLYEDYEGAATQVVEDTYQLLTYATGSLQIYELDNDAVSDAVAVEAADTEPNSTVEVIVDYAVNAGYDAGVAYYGSLGLNRVVRVFYNDASDRGEAIQGENTKYFNASSQRDRAGATDTMDIGFIASGHERANVTPQEFVARLQATHSANSAPTMLAALRNTYPSDGPGKPTPSMIARAQQHESSTPRTTRPVGLELQMASAQVVELASADRHLPSPLRVAANAPVVTPVAVWRDSTFTPTTDNVEAGAQPDGEAEVDALAPESVDEALKRLSESGTPPLPDSGDIVSMLAGAGLLQMIVEKAKSKRAKNAKTRGTNRAHWTFLRGDRD